MPESLLDNIINRKRSKFSNFQTNSSIPKTNLKTEEFKNDSEKKSSSSWTFYIIVIVIIVIIAIIIGLWYYYKPSEEGDKSIIESMSDENKTVPLSYGENDGVIDLETFRKYSAMFSGGSEYGSMGDDFMDDDDF